MAHSKRNTSLPHFTAYERGLLRTAWGTQRGVIGRDSFLPFGSCRLCLHPARSPTVACAQNGDLLCRECAINDLLAQRQEIKRLEKERDNARKRIAEEEERSVEERRERDVKEFELISMGLEAAVGSSGDGKRKRGRDEEEALARFKRREVDVGGGIVKKAGELGEGEMRDYVRREQERLREEVKREKVCSTSRFILGQYWTNESVVGSRNRIISRLSRRSGYLR
jgi:nitric oxide synthase-interacting protein